jgi:hypothetical protein
VRLVRGSMATSTLRTALVLMLLASPAAAQWRTVEPGGDTVCSDGSPYRFFVHPGDPARLLVEFEGGGGCWSADTCALDIFTRRVSLDPEEARRRGLLTGIYDRANPQNPFRTFTHVYVPYCTGDLHWGNRARTYSGPAGPFTIHHKGAANAGAALSWTFDNVQAPSQVAVVGCSAGGYGSIVWAPQIMARYSGAQAVHLSDSAAGVAPPGFLATLMESWDVSSAWPRDIPTLALDSLDVSRVTLDDVYTGVASHYPLSRFSQYNTLADSTQLFFFALTQGPTASLEEWSARMQASMAGLRANPNFLAYVAPGAQHCIVNSPAFYTTSVNGVRVVDWVTGLLSTQPPPSVP